MATKSEAESWRDSSACGVTEEEGESNLPLRVEMLEMADHWGPVTVTVSLDQTLTEASGGVKAVALLERHHLQVERRGQRR